LRNSFFFAPFQQITAFNMFKKMNNKQSALQAFFRMENSFFLLIIEAQKIIFSESIRLCPSYCPIKAAH